MQSTTPGSIIMIVLILLTALLLLCTKAWLSSSLLLDIVLRKERYEQQYRITQGLLNAGIAISKTRYAHQKIQPSEQITISWPDMPAAYHSTVELTAVTSGLQCKALLESEGRCVHAQSCILEFTSTTSSYHIHDWRLCMS